MSHLNNIFCGKAQEILLNFPDNSIDLCVTSPPYNVDLGNNKYNKTPYDLYIDNKDHEEFINDLSTVFSPLYQKLKTGGRVAINIGNGKNGAVPTVADLIIMMTKNRYIPMSQIIWNKKNTSNRAAWGSFLSPSCPSFPSPVEFILIFAKETTKLQNKGESDLSRENFIQWAYGIWEIPTETKNLGHPAPFPYELPKRLIKMLSWKGATVIDPYNGSGTTTLAARDLDRKYIGIDISQEYCDIAKGRLINNTKKRNIF
jgi:site-specific DNA-methyltransferase (adenine-specific)